MSQFQVGENVVGLIPSRELEERRAAFVPAEADVAHSIGKLLTTEKNVGLFYFRRKHCKVNSTKCCNSPKLMTAICVNVQSRDMWDQSCP